MAAAIAPPKGKNLPPNKSLYIQNLPEKLQKEDLRRSLYMLFSTYGPVLDVTALKTTKMRGQAHVLFRDEHIATQAMRSCQGFEFFGRELRISYSLNRSKALAKFTGTFHEPNAPSEQTKQIAQPPSALPPPPGSLPGPPSRLPPPPGLPQKPNGVAGLQAPTQAPQAAASPQGVKRPRDDSDNEDAPMDEDDEDDDEGAMDMSDDDD